MQCPHIQLHVNECPTPAAFLLKCGVEAFALALVLWQHGAAALVLLQRGKNNTLNLNSKSKTRT